MDLILFWIFATIAVGCAVNLVAQRRPIASALSLVGVMGSLAVLYVLLGAEFIAAAQVIVYAGAVMVLFLFVIMLLDLRAEERRRIKLFGAVAGCVCVGAFLFIFLAQLLHSPLGASSNPAVEGGIVPLGKLLFTRYLLPFEIVSILLLVGMVGVVLLSKKDLK